jgi:hypothetical protein
MFELDSSLWERTGFRLSPGSYGPKSAKIVKSRNYNAQDRRAFEYNSDIKSELGSALYALINKPDRV